MNEGLYIFGTGAHARKVFHCATEAGCVVKAFVDENRDADSPVESLSVMSPEALRHLVGAGYLFVAIGAGEVRKRLMDEYLACGWSFPSIVHPKANVAADAVLEDGVLVAAGALIESGTVVGRGTIVDIGVAIDHDCLIPPFSHLRPGIVCQPFTQWADKDF